MKELQEATFAARERTGKKIATRIKQGLIQIVEIIYDDNGNAKEKELSEYMKGNKVIDKINKIGA